MEQYGRKGEGKEDELELRVNISVLYTVCKTELLTDAKN